VALQQSITENTASTRQQASATSVEVLWYSKNMRYKAYRTNLIKKLSKLEPEIEWNITEVEVKGNQTLVVEAFNPATEKSIGISLGKYPTTRDFGKTVDTLIAQAAI